MSTTLDLTINDDGRVTAWNGQPIDPFDICKTEAAADACWRDLDVETGPVLLDYQPGNGTRYALLFVPMASTVAYDRSGERTSARIVAGNDWVLAWCTGKPAYPIRLGWVHPSYLMEKFDMSVSDAVAVSALLGSIGQRIKDMG